MGGLGQGTKGPVYNFYILQWELLYADDLAHVTESLEELIKKVKKWKENTESKALQINIVSDATMVFTRETGKYPCSICHKGVGSNSI